MVYYLHIHFRETYMKKFIKSYLVIIIVVFFSAIFLTVSMIIFGNRTTAVIDQTTRTYMDENAKAMAAILLFSSVRIYLMRWGFLPGRDYCRYLNVKSSRILPLTRTPDISCKTESIRIAKAERQVHTDGVLAALCFI